MAVIHVGTSGFSFADWVGPVYPPRLPKTGLLEYYERVLGFDSVELNFTYYTMPVARTLDAMVKRTGSSFTFAVRSHRDMTHDIWQDADRLVLKNTDDAFARFRAGIEPLVSAGRLGCVLVQLPSFFAPCAAHTGYIRRLPGLLPGVPLVVEFRNRAWLGPETYDLLRELGLGYCVVDEPRLGPLVPFDPRATSSVGYFRFHGRNRHWFTAGRSERYNYLYSREELGEFLGPVRSVAAEAGSTFLFFNNCHAGAAARNSLLMKQMLGLVENLTSEQSHVVDGLGLGGQQLDIA
jgi:uncharacterized protein YecE (DUF72 family)